MADENNIILVIFGASGDLTSRKLVPSIYNLYAQKLLPGRFSLLGVGRKKLNDEAFREKVARFLPGDKKQIKKDFFSHLNYLSIDTTLKDDYRKLKEKISTLNHADKGNTTVIYYLSTPPHVYETISENLSYHGLNHSENNKDFRRIIVEKPFGYDLDSAKKLNKVLLSFFTEDQIYRIDHYLGKETVQNIMVTRFSNSFFEPLWNRNYIDHVQITAAESIGIENRGEYFDSSGTMRDMIQNHLLLLTAMIAMEPPALSDSMSIRNEIVKVFQSLRPLTNEKIFNDIVRGQYTASDIGSGYRQESGIDAASKTETYVALKLFIDNWRWNGVPFFIRTGKRLPTRVTEAVIHFKPTPHHLFCYGAKNKQPANKLVLRIQPDEGMLLDFGMKVPGAGYQLQDVSMDFHYADLSDEALPTAYERLLLDAMKGDQTLYARADAIEKTWEFITPVLDTWRENDNIPVFGYPAGTWGPKEAKALISPQGSQWRNPCRNMTGSTEYCEL